MPGEAGPVTTGGRAHPVVAPPWVFYGAPFAPKGLWIRSELCSAQVGCPYCGSERWQPCRSVTLEGKDFKKKVIGGYVGFTHGQRRKAAKKIAVTTGIEIHVRGVGEDGGPPDGAYRICLALPPSVSKES